MYPGEASDEDCTPLLSQKSTMKSAYDSIPYPVPPRNPSPTFDHIPHSPYSISLIPSTAGPSQLEKPTTEPPALLQEVVKSFFCKCKFFTFRLGVVVKGDRLPLPSDSEQVAVIRDTLFLSSAWVENVPHVSLQRFVTKRDFSRQFLPSVYLLTEREWDRLQCIRKKITKSCKSLLFGNFLKKKILLEVSSRSPRTNLQMELSNVEMVLSTSVTEILADNIKSRIDDVLVCNGCLQNQANQLGHECVTMNFESRHSLYGDLAILSVDIELLVKDFVEKNMQMLNYINETFCLCLEKCL
ncbi:hypothetical protein AVEN_19973-1 [Araneus ventricosus]|uniref:Uncharacterized protein n=1 Tax=Araneus ventricosus TaxID=182803 RepID=A0A4Y2R8L7_ARAVE|nr:hypothetical protein AVEN_19973-1 [Araneus ventricosus]